VFFEPGRQWVEVRSAKVHRANGSVVESVQTFEQSLGDSAYRIYYDTRALILDLPQLEPGDTVELRFRVEDVSRRNAFNDYYGAVRFLQGGYPTRHLEHVLVTPKTRRFYFNEPSLPGLRHTRATEGERHVDRWLATNVEPVRGEDGMPGPAETRPYLHVSTYQSWNDVGRWWWGLAQDQLLPDESLERTTRELVAGAADTREKVARIYDWVIRNTRYVGLEFGIHGFKPYRVTQIVRRGFGDCKDKASLIYAMLKIAGVEARIALIRTRRNGSIATEPASLAVFDHAIAYVPELDLFLDGTAETNGPDDLPAMDQGVMTLLVGPETVELRQTPVLPPDRERRERTLEITLEADGAGQIEGRETIVGNTAASYRTYYQAEGMQNERLQRELSNLFPGLELSSQRFFDLDDFRAPSRFEWQGRAPNVAQRSGTRLLVPPSTIGNLLPALARAPTRRHALELGPPRTYLEQRNVRLPAGATLEPLPSGGEVESPFAKLTVRYERQGDVVRVRTEWITRTDRVSVADYPAFRAFVERADALLRERITLGGR
jgi:transglutaminase-like putative cysteine protease